MKSIFMSALMAIIVLAACNTEKKDRKEVAENLVPDSVPSSGTATAENQSIPNATSETFSIVPLTDAYISLKNALAADNGKAAASASGKVTAVLVDAEKASVPADKNADYKEIIADMQEHAEHISSNAGKLAHQREHFEMLSKDMGDVIKIFGTGGKTLYRDHCPMASNGKGADWISEIKAISNPYMGKEMATCGNVKETLK